MSRSATSSAAGASVNASSFHSQATTLRGKNAKSSGSSAATGAGSKAAAGGAGSTSSGNAPSSATTHSHFSATAPTSTLLSSLGVLALPPAFLSASSEARPQDATLPAAESAALTTLLNLIRHLSSISISSPAEFCYRECIACRKDDADHSQTLSGASTGSKMEAGAGVSAATRSRWAPVTKARKLSKARVRREEGRCTIVLYQPPIQNRSSRPNMTSRPIVSMELYSTGASQAGIYHDPKLSQTVSASEAERIASHLSRSSSSLSAQTLLSEEGTDWQAVLSAMGWHPATDFIKRGVRFVLSIPSGSAGMSGKGGRGWYTEALLYRIFEEDEEETVEDVKMELEEVKGNGAEEGKEEAMDVEVEEVQIPADGNPLQPEAAANVKAGTQPADSAPRDNPGQAQAQTQKNGKGKGKLRDVAPGTLFLQLMTTVEAGVEEEGMERAREWMGDVIAGCKSFVLLSKEE